MSEFYTNFSRQYGKVRVRGFRNGKRFDEPVNYKPFIFVKDNSGSETEFHTVDGKPVQKVSFDTMKECSTYIDEYKYVANYPIYGLTQHDYAYINQKYNKDIVSDNKLIRIGNFDIETDSENGYGKIDTADKEIISICIKIFGDKNIYMFGLKPFESQMYNEGLHYFQCKNEKELLEKFIKLWVWLDMDVITGWNIAYYDIPYIVRRIRQVLGDAATKKLSPWGNLFPREVTRFIGKTEEIFEIAGISTLDYIDIYKNFTFGNDESYKLDYIVKKELKKGKLDYSEYKTLARLYKENPDKFYDYNITDVIRVEELDMKNKFMNQIFTLAYILKVNYADTFATVRPWDIMIHNELLSQGIVIPQRDDNNRKTRKIQGGYVKQVEPGAYKWVVSFDFKSLYPHLIMLYNISPETYVNQIPQLNDPFSSVDQLLEGFLKPYTKSLVKNNFCVTGMGTVFTRDFTGFFPKIMKKLFDLRTYWNDEEQRLEALIANGNLMEPEKEQAELKKVEAYNRQMALKILLNSGYGAMTNEYFRWFSMVMGESITLSGQLWIRSVNNAFNKYLNELMGTEDYNYVIGSDTDSAYLTLDLILEKFGPKDGTMDEIVTWLDNFASNNMKKVLTDTFEALYAETNAHNKCMSMAREIIAEKAIWTGKKHYVMKVRDKKKARYIDKAQYKIMGMEAVKSSTPSLIREHMKKTIEIVLDGDRQEVIDYISNFRKTYETLPIVDIASPRGTTDLISYQDRSNIYGKGTPMHIKSALLYNFYRKVYHLEDTIPQIFGGDKIKFIPLITPNPIGEEVIGFSDELPDEFGLAPYIDYQKQFEKTYYNPMSELAAAAGIPLDDTTSLEDFYA